MLDDESMSLIPLRAYDEARNALAMCKTVDDVKEIADRAVAMKAYARQAKDRGLEADATEIRIRAETRLGEMLIEHKATVGFASGGERGGKVKLDGSRSEPSNVRPTLEEA